MVRSTVLSPAEVLLFDIMHREHKAAVDAADALLRERTAALYASHALPLTTAGTFQVDPLNRSVVTFLYDDGAE